MLLAERAILVQLQSFRIVLLVLHRVVVPVLAFGFIIHIIYACYLTYCNIAANMSHGRIISVARDLLHIFVIKDNFSKQK